MQGPGCGAGGSLLSKQGAGHLAGVPGGDLLETRGQELLSRGQEFRGCRHRVEPPAASSSVDIYCLLQSIRGNYISPVLCNGGVQW